MGLISLDRLNILKDRVLLSVIEYKTLLKSLEKAFKNNNLELIDSLQLSEKEILKTLTQRVKIFKSHIKHLKTLGKNSKQSIIKIETEVYTNIDDLNNVMEIFQNKLKADRIELQKEMTQVGRRIKPMGSGRDYTARRIDIIT